MDHTNKKIKISSPKGLHCIISYNYLASFGYCYLKSNVFCASCMFFSVSCSNFKINTAISGAAAPYFSKVIQLSTHKSWVTPFWFLVKLYIGHAIELIPSLKNHALILGTKSFPWKIDEKMQGNLKGMT